MRIPPLDVLITWPAPNYVDPQTRGNASVIVNAICIFFVVVAVALRFYCRSRGGPMKLGWDDAMIAVALFFTFGMTAVVILADKAYGWDRHIWDIEASDITRANIIAFTAKIDFTLAATFTRLSLCCFYYRLVKDSGIRWFQWAVHFTAAFNVAICISFIFLTVFLCTPVQYYWEYPPTTAGKCLDEGIATLVSGILNIVADALTTAVPVPLVMRLRMPLRQRVGVSVLFGLGFIVIIAGSIRTYYIWKGLVDSWDETWYAYPLWIAAAVEIYIGVICACAPALKTLLHTSSEGRRSSPAYSSSRRSPAPAFDDKLPTLSESTKQSRSASRSVRYSSTPTVPNRLRISRLSALIFPRWSNQDSQHGSMRLRSMDSDTRNAPPKTGAAFHATPILPDPDEDEDERPVLRIMRRQSVEMDSLRGVRSSRLIMSEELPESADGRP